MIIIQQATALCFKQWLFSGNGFKYEKAKRLLWPFEKVLRSGGVYFV